MYKSILIPTDGSELSNLALVHGMKLAKAVGANVKAIIVSLPFHALAVDTEMLSDNAASYKEHSAKRVQRTLDAVTKAAKDAGVACETLNLENEEPYRAIIDTAKQRGCDLIVMASHGRRGMSAMLLGSETTKVLTHSTVPVLVVRAAHH